MDDVKPKVIGGSGFVQFFFVLSVALCVLLYAPPVFVHIPFSSTDFLGSSGAVDAPVAASDDEMKPPVVHLDNQVGSPCSAMRNDSICCDRSDWNTDVCFMAGDVRTDAASLSLLLFSNQQKEHEEEERIRPYTRKWERFIMDRVHEVRLRRKVVTTTTTTTEEKADRCDVRHDAPLLVMTAGGYTGNLFHAFNDGFLPAWLTTQHLRRRVVLGVLAYNPWWAGTFARIVEGLSAYDVIDLLNDKRTHCFPGAIVGSRFHGTINVDPARLKDNKTVVDFHNFLAKSFHGEQEEKQQRGRRRPKLGLVSRKGTRVIENEKEVANLARSMGFDVEILETATGLPLSAEYARVSACDAMVGVHGADLTKFLFLRPGHASLTQISPLGISPAARDDFGTPSERMGLLYEQYEVAGHESSLSRKYKLDDVVITDPEEAIKRNGGWPFVANVYLRGQNVTLDLARFRHTLARMHARAMLSRQLPEEKKQ